MKESLEAKEKRKTTDQSTLFPGRHGHVLTHPEFIKKIEAQRQTHADEEESQRQRQVVKAEKRVEKKKLEDQWQQIKWAHERAMEKWNAECAQLTANKVPKKDLPKHPTWPLKLTLTILATSSQVQLEDLDHESDRQSIADDDEFTS
jgi:hypothetical protein